MGQLEEKIRELIEDRYRSIPRLAKDTGVPEQTIYSALNKSLRGASTSTTLPILEKLELDPISFMHGSIVHKSEQTGSTSVVPLYGSISAGHPTEPDQIDGVFPVPAALHERFPKAFMLRIEGNSMNLVMPNGFYALIDPCTEVEISGQLYAVGVGESNATVKRVRVLDNGIELQPLSDDVTYHKLVFDYAHPGDDSVSVIGRVVWFCPPLDWVDRGI